MITILAIGAIQSLFFSFLIMRKREKTTADKILMIWLLVLFVQIFANYLEFTGYYDKFPHLVGSTSSLIFLYGPLLYFYVKWNISDTTRFRKVYLLHFLPFLLYNIAMVPFYLQGAAEKLTYHQNEGIIPESEIILTVSLVCKTLVLPVYLIWAFILLKSHSKKVEEYFSDIENIDLKWLRFMVESLFVLSLVLVLATVVKLLTDFTFETEPYIFSAATLWIFALGYYGLKQTPIFVDSSKTSESIDLGKQKTRYEKNKLKASEAERYKELLLNYMEEEKPFLKNKITLHEVASAINIPSHHLSQVLNDKIKQNFFDFINGYRIEALKKKLKDPKSKHLTMLGIANDCGFNSKASFNRIFKKSTGLTPSEYLKNTNTEVSG